MTGAGILDAIGDTPLVRLQRIAPESGAEIRGEARVPQPDRLDEGPHGAVDARWRGTRRPAGGGATVLQYTGGSTGPALALVCRSKGYRTRIVISECFSESGCS